MKKQEQNTKETVSMLVYGYLVILFAGLPLYMQNKLVMIGNAKYLFFRNTTLVLGAFVVLAVLWQRIRGERTTKRTWKKTDVFMLLYLVYLSEKDNKFLENNNYTKEEVLSGFKQLLMKSGYSDLLYLLK